MVRIARNPRTPFALAVIIVAAALVALALFRAPFFAINDVQITGAARTTDGAIRHALAFAPDQALVSIDRVAAETAVEELPWVAEAKVVRRWPSMVRVTIRERTPAAAVGGNSTGEWLVVDDESTVLERRLTPPHGLPLVVAPLAVTEGAFVGSRLLATTDVVEASLSVPEQLDPWIESWLIDRDGLISADLRGSAMATFGRGTDYQSQFVSLASIVGGNLELTCVSEIDLTTPDTPILDRDEDCLEASRAMTETES